MARQVGISLDYIDQPVTGPEIIGQGQQAIVELDRVSMVVTKQFRDTESQEAVSASEREFDCLARLSRAFAELPHVSCPAPVSFDPERGLVEMTYCPGRVLDTIVNEPDGWIDEHLAHIARQIADGVYVYVREIEEPFDLAIVNFLYDAETRNLSFVDVSSPPNAREFVVPGQPLHSSLGLFVGSSIYIASHWEDLFHPWYWNRIRHLVLAVLQRIGERTEIDPALVMRIAHGSWNASLRAERRVHRYVWYATAGRTFSVSRFRQVRREWSALDESGRAT